MARTAAVQQALVVQRVVENAKLGQRERPVGQGPGLHHLSFVERADLLNCPLRIRTGGCVVWRLGGRSPWLPD